MFKTASVSRDVSAPSRRQFLNGVGQLTLSATAIALVAGREAVAAGKGKPMAASPTQDVTILNVALGLEHEAIGAYQISAESGLLEKPVLDVAVLFQSQHKEHRDALINAVRTLGGTPVETKSIDAYKSALNVATIKSQKDVLTLAARLERGAANAYLGVIPSFADPALAQIAGRLAADETMHWTVLAQVLGLPLPTGALSFGA
jgi:rubrerythrin